MSKSISGYYVVRNREKYSGNLHNVFYRSLWERGYCKWCDGNPKVIKWAIEPFSINYFDTGKRKYRKYYPDFFVQMENGNKYLIEVKPDYETRPPVKQKRRTKRLLLAEATYTTNTCKWDAAQQFCECRNWSFHIVTEHTLKKMGIKLIGKMPKKKRKKKKGSAKK